MPPVNHSVDTTASQPTLDQTTESSREGVEPSSWWILISMALGMVGAYMLLAVHLILDATNARAWMWTLLAVPLAFFCSSAVALFVGSDLSPRERLAAASAAVFGYSPRDKSPRSTQGRP
jgi:hypothetical protein